MGTTLQHGIFLPAEGERNCYAGLASNWTILDGVVGGYSSHAANLTIHVTAEDKSKWDAVTGKADSSALTAHTGDNTIHVTAADKAAWNGKADASALTAHTGDTTIHVTAADKAAWNGKANDADAVHKSGAETIAGLKTFTDLLTSDGDYMGSEASTNQRTNFQLRSNRDKAGKSAAFITRFRPNRAQGGMQTADVQKIGFDIMENETRTNNVFDIQCTGWNGDVPTRINFVSSASEYSFGRSILPCMINDLSPGALSLPNLSAGVDISGYLDASQVSTNTYTPPANGWISISITSPARGSILAQSGDTSVNAYGSVDPVDATKYRVSVFFPCFANNAVSIYLRATGGSLNFAKFYPCQGNV